MWPMNDELERYLSEIASQLNVDPAQGREILNEIRSHIAEAAAEGLPVALAITFKWLLLPLLRDVAHWQASPTPVIFACLALLALLVPGLTFKRWRYGYSVWAFFSLVTIAQL
jgi:hypothetical protein